MPDTILEIEGAIAKVVINRPPVNALTIDSYREITAVFLALAIREDINCIILTGSGHRAFCAGFDFRQFAAAGSAEDDPRRPEILRGMFEAIRTCPIPVIGAINGPAIGAGCVIAAVCDIRLAALGARFGLPEIDFGRVGGGAYLAPLVSPGRMRMMAFSGRPITAEEALQTGLVEELLPPDQLMERAKVLAGVIAGKNGTALRYMKGALDGMTGLLVTDAYRLEQDYSLRLRAVNEGSE